MFEVALAAAAAAAASAPHVAEEPGVAGADVVVVVAVDAAGVADVVDAVDAVGVAGVVGAADAVGAGADAVGAAAAAAGVDAVGAECSLVFVPLTQLVYQPLEFWPLELAPKLLQTIAVSRLLIQ